MTDTTAGEGVFASLKADLAEEIRVAAEQSEATPMERFVAEALTSDDAKVKGLVDRVWVVSLPDARKAIAAIAAWEALAAQPSAGAQPVDDLAQEIRRADGSNTLGAGALAEALWPFVIATPAQPDTGEIERLNDQRVEIFKLLLNDAGVMVAPGEEADALRRYIEQNKSQPDTGDVAALRSEIIAAIKEAMTDAWADICSDTGCWPADLQRVGKSPVRLEYRPAIWTESTAEMAANRILAALSKPNAQGRVG